MVRRPNVGELVILGEAVRQIAFFSLNLLIAKNLFCLTSPGSGEACLTSLRQNVPHCLFPEIFS